MRAPWIVAVALGSVLVTGCGHDAADGGSPTAKSTCVAHATAAPTPYPAGFPTDWPLPPGTVVTSAEDTPGGVLLSAVVSTPFDDVLEFMNDQVTGAGFVSHGGESEAEDAESEWSGNGFHGRLALEASDECEGDTRIDVVASAD